MALENDTQAVADAMEELRKNGVLSAEALAKLGGNTTTAYKALQGYTQKLVGATGSLGGMARAVADGEGSFKSLGSSITGLTGMIGTLASAIPLVGGAAKALAEGVGQAAKFVLDQLDTMAKNYQTLGDASAGATDGVDGLLRQFNQLGNYSLPAFAKSVKVNTVGLSALNGTAAAGAEQLSKVAGALTTGDTAQRFLKLGMSLDAVGDATTEFLSSSARYGILQGNTTEELTKKTQNYIIEVDKIARLTGQTREAQQKEAQKSLVDARFRAKIADMQANGQGDQALQLKQYVEGLGGAAGDAARALVTGIPLTKEAAAANLFANDAIRQNTLAIQEGKTAAVAIADTQQELANGTVRFGKQIMYAGDQFGGVAVQAFDTAAMLAEQNKLMATGLTREQAVEAIQKKQMEASGKTTEEFTAAQLATAGASKNMQSLGFSLASAAVPAVNSFATALEKVTGYINQNFGVGGTSSTPAGVNRGPAGGPAAGSGTGKLAGVNGKLASAVTQAINDYEKLTGKTATITSGVRDREKQQRMYNEYIAGGKQGKPVAKPGNSLHETGNAVDISESAANDMDRLGLLKKYGLARPVANDPVHVQLAGPRNGYKSAALSTPGPVEGARGNGPGGSEQPADSDRMTLTQKLQMEQNAILREQLAVSKKQLQHTKQ
jgi:LAS superfamily LD-carboxypeptidase LdcB